MNKPWEVVKNLEAVSGRLDKEAILKVEAEANNDEFFKGVTFALNPLITFGVKKVEEKKDSKPKDPKPTGLTPKAFWDLVNRLSSRQLTGNDALFQINHARMKCDKDEWNNWYRRILIKDLRCGVSEKTVNKITEAHAKQYTIPIFSCQLAHDSTDHEEKVTGHKMIETKLDGVRVITIVYPSGQVVQYSRNGKELVNFEVIKKQIAKHAIFFSEPIVLDGEVMSASFQDLMKQVHRKSDVAADDAVLYLFDILTLNEFIAGASPHRQIDRSFSLKSWYETVKDHMPNVQILETELVNLNEEAGQKRFKEINKNAIDGGYEGIMIKDPTAPYECKRSYAWLKLKPFIEVTLKAVKIEEGEGKNAGKMGAVLFEGIDDGKFISVSVGGGWSDKQRAQIWAEHTGKPVIWQKKVKGVVTDIVEKPTGAKVIGQLGEVRGDAATKAQDSESWSLRFPRFKTWRGFGNGEKL